MKRVVRVRGKPKPIKFKGKAANIKKNKKTKPNESSDISPDLNAIGKQRIDDVAKKAETAVGSIDDAFRNKFEEFTRRSAANQDDNKSTELSIIDPNNNTTASQDIKTDDDNSYLAGIYTNTTNIYKLLEERLTAIADTEPDSDFDAFPVDEESDESKDKKKRKKEGDDDKKYAALIKLLSEMKGGLSTLVAKFIGYSLEMVAKIAKWTLIIGALVFAVDVAIKAIQSWVQDILKGGESSIKLFGTYLPMIQDLLKTFQDGVDDIKKSFGNEDQSLWESIKNLFSTVLDKTGTIIKTAIMDGIGSLIENLGIATNLDSVRMAGENMRAAALDFKIAAGLPIKLDEQELLLKRDRNNAQDELDKIEDEKTAIQWNNNINEPRNYAAPIPKKKEGEKTIDERIEEQKAIVKGLGDKLLSLQDTIKDVEEKKANGEAIDPEVVKAIPKEQYRPEPTTPLERDMNKAMDIMLKDQQTESEKAFIDKVTANANIHLEENPNESFIQRFGDYDKAEKEYLLRTGQASPDFQSMEDFGYESDDNNDTPPQANINISNKNNNFSVQNSIQRTEYKPLVSV